MVGFGQSGFWEGIYVMMRRRIDLNELVRRLFVHSSFLPFVYYLHVCLYVFPVCMSVMSVLVVPSVLSVSTLPVLYVRGMSCMSWTLITVSHGINRDTLRFFGS